MVMSRANKAMAFILTLQIAGCAVYQPVAQYDPVDESLNIKINESPFEPRPDVQIASNNFDIDDENVQGSSTGDKAAVILGFCLLFCNPVGASVVLHYGLAYLMALTVAYPVILVVDAVRSATSEETCDPAPDDPSQAACESD